MFGKTMLLTMIEFNYRTNNLLLDLATHLTLEQWEAQSAFIGQSLREIMFHLLAVEEEWLHLCRQREPNFKYRELADFPDLASLRSFSDRVYESAHAYLESVDDDGLTATVFALLPDEREHTVIIWRVLVHALYHSAQHRSEAAAILTSYNQSPGSIDFFGYMWER